MSAAAAEILERQVYASGASRAFGELTTAEVTARAQELREMVGWGPTARVAPVARAWRVLAEALQASGAERVAELPAERIEELAPQLWMVLP